MIVCFLVGISQNLYGSSDEKNEKKIITRTLAFLKVNTAIQYLKPYLSSKGKITAVWESNTLIISDIPQRVEMLNNLIEVIDVPLTEIQFTIDLISGSRGKVPKGDTDKELRDDPLIRELQGVLKYNSFKNMGTTIIKVQNNSSSTHWLAKNLQLIIAPQATPEGNIVVELTLLNYRGIDKKGKAIKTVLVQTKLTIKNKEKTVVGVSKLNGDDNALILFITGTFIEYKSLPQTLRKK
jgi:type II secretory pathway component GspD/PulD (secretin)